MAQVHPEDIRANSYAGFETITCQIEHKLLNRGFQLNVIAIGKRPSKMSPRLAGGPQGPPMRSVQMFSRILEHTKNLITLFAKHQDHDFNVGS